MPGEADRFDRILLVAFDEATFEFYKGFLDGMRAGRIAPL
jgi:hypothetical protein